jgi:hypothetical protein
MSDVSGLTPLDAVEAVPRQPAVPHSAADMAFGWPGSTRKAMPATTAPTAVTASDRRRVASAGNLSREALACRCGRTAAGLRGSHAVCSPA